MPERRRELLLPPRIELEASHEGKIVAKYLLVPVMPTPNGPLHLGHIAGPYLKMDVLARFLRREGHTVALVLGDRSIRDTCIAQSNAPGDAPEDVCARFHTEIDRGLRCMHIEYDCFLDPLDPRYGDRLKQLTTGILESLFEKGLIVIRHEEIPYSTRFGWPIIGSFIGGTCPVCGVTDAGGFHCEECGAENSPAELLDTRSEIEGDRWEWRRFRSAFLAIDRPDRIDGLLQTMEVDPHLLRVAKPSQPKQWPHSYQSSRSLGHTVQASRRIIGIRCFHLFGLVHFVAVVR